jgi:hypothetical protein
LRGVDCDSDHYVLVDNFRERMEISKQAAQNFEVENFKHRKLNELEVRKEYQIKFSKSFAALEDLNDNEDINSAWENTKHNIKNLG